MGNLNFIRFCCTVYVPTAEGVSGGDRRCMCEIDCSVNIMEFLEGMGIGMTDIVVDAIGGVLPVSLVSYIDGSGVVNKRVVVGYFTVTGMAVCSDEDEWDEEKGRKICMSKAKRKAYRKLVSLNKALGRLVGRWSEGIADSVARSTGILEVEEWWIKEVSG